MGQFLEAVSVRAEKLSRTARNQAKKLLGDEIVDDVVLAVSADYSAGKQRFCLVEQGEGAESGVNGSKSENWASQDRIGPGEL